MRLLRSNRIVSDLQRRANFGADSSFICFSGVLVGCRRWSTAAAPLEVDDDESFSAGADLLWRPTSPRPRLRALRERLKEESDGSHELSLRKITVNSKDTKQVKRNEKASPSYNVPKEPKTVKDWERLLSILPDPPSPDKILTDQFGRHHSYLRLSLTERCNFRCTYCMPLDGVPLQPPEALLSTTEILQLAESFTKAGVTKFRLTGGEPTLRKDLVAIVSGLRAFRPHQIGITTNGLTLHRMLPDLVHAGLTSVNISLDTLQPDRFARLARRPASYLDQVLQSLQVASEDAGLSVKVNCVVMRGQNDDELADFVELGERLPGVSIRFIEYMPFADNGWKDNKFVSYREMLNRPELQGLLQPVPASDPHDTTKWYQSTSNCSGSSATTTVGFITSMSHHFCAGCNRLRITADGRIKVCLFDAREAGLSSLSLRDALRAGLTEDQIYKLVYNAVQTKQASLGGHASAQEIADDSHDNRPMTLIGG